VCVCVCVCECVSVCVCVCVCECVCVCVCVCVYVCVCVPVTRLPSSARSLPSQQIAYRDDRGQSEAVLQRCYRGVTVVLQWCHSGVTTRTTRARQGVGSSLQNNVRVHTFMMICAHPRYTHVHTHTHTCGREASIACRGKMEDTTVTPL
jgi:hypothetical protein